MTMSDPIADMLTRIRNANTAKHDTVDVPASKMKLAIANILLDEGYIEKYDVIEDGVFKTIHITLKYGADKNEKVITGLKRISKPGLRVYANSADVPKVFGGLGTAIISTNHGVKMCIRDRSVQSPLVVLKLKVRKGGDFFYGKSSNENHIESVRSSVSRCVRKENHRNC